MSQGQRSLTQIEALLESHAYGAPVTLVETALAMMAGSPASLHYQSALLGGQCGSRDAIERDRSVCLNDQHVRVRSMPIESESATEWK